MIRPASVYKDYREAGALHAHVAPFAFISPAVFLTKKGDLGVILRVQAVDHECLDFAELDFVTRRFESVLKLFDERFTLYQYLLKRRNPEIPCRTDYEDPVLRHAISSRLDYIKARSDRLYQLEIYFAILYRGCRHSRGLQERLTQILSHPMASLSQAFSSAKNILVLEEEIEEGQKLLLHRAEAFVIQLRDLIKIDVLDKRAAFTFFRRLLNYTPYKANSFPLRYDSHIDYFAAGETLECHRDHLRLDDHYIKVLTLTDPPGQTAAHLLHCIQEIPSNLIAVSEWVREDHHLMRRRIQAARRHYHNSRYSLWNYIGSKGQRQPAPEEMLKDDSADALVSELGACLTELEVAGRSFGRFSFTVILYDKDPDRLERSAAECFKVFSAHDALVREERYNLINAWFAVIPGNSAYNLRQRYLSSTNLADLSFLFAPHGGETRNRHLNSEYLTVLETCHGTPYYLNLHHNDIAHTLILGATGSGKSFFLNFLLTHAQKYSPLTFIFDLGRSYEHVTRLFGGSYLSAGIEKRSFTINPFSLPPTKENLQFLHAFVRVLITSGGHRLTTREDQDLYDQISSLYEIDRENRRLFTLANILGRNLREALARWVEGGQYGALFDNVEDNLTLARFQCFEFEAMDRYPQVLEPLLFYILHRANMVIHDQALETTFKITVIDEAWRFLRDPAIRLYITEALKTWRKHNAAILIATQSRADLDASGIEAALVESCPTRIFFANPGIDRAIYRAVFHLNETEAERIANLIPKRQMLIKRPGLSKVVNLDAGPEGYWLYTNDPYDNERRRQSISRYGFKEGLRRLAVTASN